MVAFLFFGTMSFLFLSASMAALFGLQNLRMVGFSLLFVSLCLAGVLARPRFDGRFLQFPVMLLFLLALIAAADMGSKFDPLDFKIAFPIIALMVAPNLAHGLSGVDVPRIFWWLLTIYVTVTFIAILAGSCRRKKRQKTHSVDCLRNNGTAHASWDSNSNTNIDAIVIQPDFRICTWSVETGSAQGGVDRHLPDRSFRWLHNFH